MGCDIHIVVERRWEGRWIGVRTDAWLSSGSYADASSELVAPAVGRRNYAFFARLAGVRGTGPVPHGLPDDASDLTLALSEDWEGDGHSHSWLPLKEFADRWCATDEAFIATLAAERLEGKLSAYARLLDRASIGAFDVYDDIDVDDFRVVFWFDN